VRLPPSPGRTSPRASSTTRTEVLDRDALDDAIAAGRQFHGAAAFYIERRGVTLKEG
jgi:hypothetical protein